MFLPLDLLEKHTSSYQGEHAYKFNNLQEYNNFAKEFRVADISFKTKIQKKPVAAYYIIPILD